MLLHAEASFAMPTAHCGAAFFKQAGVDIDFVKLADLGIHGNGHEHIDYAKDFAALLRVPRAIAASTSVTKASVVIIGRATEHARIG